MIGAFAATAERIAAQTSGFRMELLSNLSKFRELTILDLQAHDDLSGVDYVLTAECRPASDEMRLSVVLQATLENRVVWSDTYRLSLAEWTRVQRQLVGRIASNVEIYLSHDRLTSLQRLPEHPGVYDAWLRGEHLLSRWSAEAEDEAERLFELAVAEDPNFAPPHASLASVHNTRQFIRPGLPHRLADRERALHLASRAVELDPLNSRNLMVVAWSAAMMHRFEQAELYFELASELNPNHPKVLVSASLGLAFMERTDLARKLLDQAMALTSVLPAYQWSHITIICFLLGEYERSVEAADRSQNAILDTPGWKAAALGKLGRTEERQAALAELVHAAGVAWSGPSAPSRDDIVRWFLEVFPMRDVPRQNLVDALL